MTQVKFRWSGADHIGVITAQKQWSVGLVTTVKVDNLMEFNFIGKFAVGNCGPFYVYYIKHTKN